jgi:predicted metal-dependent hydrolase
MMNRYRLRNGEIRYSVRKNANPKYVQLKFRPNLELEVTIPSKGHIDVEKILARKRRWIERKHDELTTTTRIFDGQRVLYHGIPYRVIFSRTARKTKVGGRRITLPLLDNEESQEALKRWMTNETKRFLQRRLGNYQRKLHLPFKGFSVKDTKRWAFCRERHLVFNWQLAALPRELADYVVLHEISHLKEFNHSQKFRYVLASLCPDYREKEAMLRTYVAD